MTSFIHRNGEEPGAEPAGLRHLVRALRHRNYRLYFGGQSISLVGTWMQRVAVGWLAYRLTGSALTLGQVGFAMQIPMFLLAPFAGVLVDRWNLHRALMVTQILAMAQATLLAVLVATGAIEVWHLVALSVTLGVINAVDLPARQSFIVRMIDRKDDLGNAIALNSSMVHAAGLIGPSVAGILIGTVGETACFAANALSYVPVIAALAGMKLPLKAAPRRNGRMIDGVREGVAYTFGFAPIRNIILLVAVVSLVGMPYTVLMPVFARDVLGGDARTLGFLMGASGCGAFAGTIYLASRRNVRGLKKLIAYAAAAFGVGLAAFSLSRAFPLSLLIMFGAGLGLILLIASSNTVVQTVVDDDKRGRVMSFFTMAFLGVAPFGSLLAGALAERIGAPHTILAGGAACVAAAAVFGCRIKSMRVILHPIYREKGIVPGINP
jgi:MFS family permease